MKGGVEMNKQHTVALSTLNEKIEKLEAEIRADRSLLPVFRMMYLCGVGLVKGMLFGVRIVDLRISAADLVKEIKCIAKTDRRHRGRRAPYDSYAEHQPESQWQGPGNRGRDR
jgi:hypothetical protein